MTAAKRIRLSPEARREQLLELGVQMLTTRTLDELSVETIAEEAGISRGLLFHYFRNKQDFHRAVVQRAADDLLDTTAPDPALEPIPRLMQSVSHYVDYVSANYRSYLSLVRGAASGDDTLREIFDHTRAVLTKRITDNMDVFGLTDGPREQLLARGWSALVEEIVLAWVAEQQISKDELLAVLTATLPALLSVQA
ncbi:MAG TPA: TetR/AcrR family transcriptional regulator [Jatrophihabitans sp.]|nr:TetR/AcrR family transcriptional regulator [Jatrophihabitans sp.]